MLVEFKPNVFALAGEGVDAAIEANGVSLEPVPEAGLSDASTSFKIVDQVEQPGHELLIKGSEVGGD